jgi:hypothetical protein
MNIDAVPAVFANTESMVLKSSVDQLCGGVAGDTASGRIAADAWIKSMALHRTIGRVWSIKFAGVR